MKIRILTIGLLLIGVFLNNQAFAESEEREVASFSKIALKIPAKLYLEQGKKQSVEIVAKSTTLEEIITEVKGRTLSIRFPAKNIFRNFQPGKIEIYITAPEIDGLLLSGSGDIIADDIESRIIELSVSGSGDIEISSLKTDRVTANVSGSGDITIHDGGIADDLGVTISGSGDVKASGFEATDVSVRISGSGNCDVKSNGTIKARIAGSGNVNYKGKARIDSAVAGSGSVRKM